MIRLIKDIETGKPDYHLENILILVSISHSTRG